MCEHIAFVALLENQKPQTYPNSKRRSFWSSTLYQVCACMWFLITFTCKMCMPGQKLLSAHGFGPEEGHTTLSWVKDALWTWSWMISAAPLTWLFYKYPACPRVVISLPAWYHRTFYLPPIAPLGMHSEHIQPAPLKSFSLSSGSNFPTSTSQHQNTDRRVSGESQTKACQYALRLSSASLFKGIW